MNQTIQPPEGYEIVTDYSQPKTEDVLYWESIAKGWIRPSIDGSPFYPSCTYARPITRKPEMTEEQKAEWRAKRGTVVTEAKPKEDKFKLPHVRIINSRDYVAAQILKKHGWEKGITDDMIAEMNAAYGVDNDYRSLQVLVSAWHVLNGWFEKYEVKEQKRQKPREVASS